MNKVNLNIKSIVPVESACAQVGVMQIGACETGAVYTEKIDSSCHTEKERQALIQELKQCYSEQDIDTLFEKANITDYSLRSAILRECMDAVYILSAGVQLPKFQNMSLEQKKEVEYKLEKSTFLDGYWR